ncbi:MAG: hypothetical protein FJ271_06150 [Planctomycetes bacterium]|nr:hypothetical protein [Planctomycetota bacterium]
MPIRFKCTSCQKGLVVKDHLGGKRVACPACKKPVIVPAAQPATQPAAAPPAPQLRPEEVEALAAAALAEEDNKKKAEEAKAAPKPSGTIDFTCDFCDAQLKLPLDLAGKKSPCPECKRIIRVPNPKEDKPKDWRTVQEGPSVALAAQKPPAPEGTWDAGTVKRVSMEALTEADAIPEEEAEPVGVLGWIRRAAIAAALGGVVWFAGCLINRQQREVAQKDSLEQVMEMVESKSKDKLPDDITAEVLRRAGEIHARKSEASKARTLFRAAYSKLSADPNRISPEVDLSLVELALSMLELGGNERDAIAKERVKWSDLVEKDLGVVLGRIHADEARIIGLRALVTRLFAQGQGALADTLVRRLIPLDGGRSLLQAQLIAILLEQGKAAEVAKQFPLPEAGAEIDVITRCGYAEGKARKGDIDGARNIATIAGPTEGRLLATLGVAELLQDNPNGGEAAKAAMFIGPAAQIMNEEMKGAALPPWSRYQLVKAYARSGQLETARDWLKPRGGDDKRAAELKSWGELEIVRARLAKLDGAAADAAIPEEVKDKNSLAHALAWEIWARHNAHHGHGGDVRDILETTQDLRIRAMLLTGIALGN